MKLKRILLGVGALLLLLVAYPAVKIGGAIVTAPRYEVTSIAEAPTYQDAALMERALALPVAKSFPRPLSYQSNGSFCGPASLANVMTSLGVAGQSEATVLDGSGKCVLGMCFMGLTLDELAELARHQDRRATVLRDLDLASFRQHLRQSNDPSRRYVANFHRGPLFSRGGGHHSPIGGYLEEQDLVLVLDVNRDYQPWLVPAERLFAAIDTVDGESDAKRGLLLIE